MKRMIPLCALILILSGALSACRLNNEDYHAQVREYALICKDGDLSVLDQFPNLEYVDLRGSTCYEEIAAYAAAHPEITVRSSVQLGEKRFEQSSIAIALYCYETDFDILMENLKFFPSLQTLQIHEITFTAEQLAALKEAYPHIEFAYSVEFCGKSFDHDVTQIDLAYISASDIDSALEGIALLPELKSVRLMDSIGVSNLELEDAAKLICSFPEVDFEYQFSLFGQTVSTLSEKLVFESVPIGNEGLDTLRNALSVLNNCSYLLLDGCGISNENMAQLRDEYPQMQIVWRIQAGPYSILTDEQMIRMGTGLTDKNSADLKYCTQVRYMDLSYSKVSEIDFVQYMPQLECAILMVSEVEDVQPFASCRNLVWLELCGCSAIEDISALASLPSLKYLNIAATSVKDLSALDASPLLRLNCVSSKVKGDALKHFVEHHPDCLTVSTGSTLGYGWRYNDKDEKEMFEYYAKLREIFRYDDPTFNGHK